MSKWLKLIIMIITSTPFIAKSTNGTFSAAQFKQQHKLLLQVNKLKPKMAKTKTYKIITIIISDCPHSWQSIAVGILFTESSFREKAISKTGDLGIGQINQKYWPIFSKSALLTLDYGTKASCKILTYHKNRKHHWSAYHSLTPSLAKTYTKKVMRYI